MASRFSQGRGLGLSPDGGLHNHLASYADARTARSRTRPRDLEVVLGRRIARVDDGDTYVSRPHAAGRDRRRAGRPRVRQRAPRGASSCGWRPTTGPVLGLHLGMAGRIVVDGGRGRLAVGPVRGRVRRRHPDGAARQAPARPRRAQSRFQPRRSGRRGVEPRRRSAASIGAGHTAVKARLLNQHAISGRRQPARRSGAVAGADRPRTLDTRARPTRIWTGCGASCAPRCARRSARAACTPGAFIPARGREGHCPRDGHALDARDGRRAHHVLVPGLPALSPLPVSPCA